MHTSPQTEDQRGQGAFAAVLAQNHSAGSGKSGLFPGTTPSSQSWSLGTERVSRRRWPGNIAHPAFCLPPPPSPPVTLEQVSTCSLLILTPSLPAILQKCAVIHIPTRQLQWKWQPLPLCSLPATQTSVTSLSPPQSAAPGAQGRPRDKAGRAPTSLRWCSPSSPPLEGKRSRGSREVVRTTPPSPQEGGRAGSDLGRVCTDSPSLQQREGSLFSRGLVSCLLGTPSGTFLSGLRLTFC